MYARLVATLDPCAPDLSPELMQQLKGEFRFRVSLLNTYMYIIYISLNDLFLLTYKCIIVYSLCTCMYVRT